MNFKHLIALLIGLLFSSNFSAQYTIKGTFPNLAGQKITLFGFQDFGTYAIDSTTISAKGDFLLQFSTKNLGMGYLVAEDQQPFLVSLSEEVELKGESFKSSASIIITKGEQNQSFEKYASEHQRREQALSGWDYLTKIYNNDSLFNIHQTPKKEIEREIARIKKQDVLFIDRLNTDSYMKYYLPLRKLINSSSIIAQYRTEEIASTIDQFRNIDYTDSRLRQSGLLADVIEKHFWLIENSGIPLDSVFVEMNKSIDLIVDRLLPHETELNITTEYLFKLLEKRSLFKSSEYLALKLLQQKKCTINSNFAGQLETYRTMKKGNIAPDFNFENDIIAPGYESGKIPKKLSDLKNKFTVLVFGASWCPACPQELSKISSLYSKWKKQDVDVIFVSLDEDEKLFKNFVSIFPFISMCNYQKWESPIVKKYHVFATPTIYLLNSKREILLRPNSVNQLDSWVEWYLIKGNK